MSAKILIMNLSCFSDVNVLLPLVWYDPPSSHYGSACQLPIQRKEGEWSYCSLFVSFSIKFPAEKPNLELKRFKSLDLSWAKVHM